MRFKTLSMCRLKTNVSTFHKKLTASNGMDFSILVSSESNRIEQFYILDSHWESQKDSKVTPLAHIQVSKITGNVKIASFNPENWNLNLESVDLMSKITALISNNDLNTPSNRLYVAH